MLHGPPEELDRVVHAGLLMKVASVGVNRFKADAEPGRNFLSPKALADQPQHHQLSRRQHFKYQLRMRPRW